MPKATPHTMAAPSGIDLEAKIRLLDGRNINVSFHKPFSIKGDMRTHTWDFSWMRYQNRWALLLRKSLLQLLQTHSLSYANHVAEYSRRMFNNDLFIECDSITLDQIARVPDFLPMSYWPFLQPLLKRMASGDEIGASQLEPELSGFLGKSLAALRGLAR